MSEELKPCLLCEKSGYSMPRKIMIDNNKSETVGWACGCVNCDVHVYGDTQVDAEKKWNTRPVEDTLNRRIVELENKLADTKRKAQWELNELREAKDKRIFDLLEALAKAIGIADHRSYELEAKTKEAEESAREVIKLKAELYDLWKEMK